MKGKKRIELDSRRENGYEVESKKKKNGGTDTSMGLEMGYFIRVGCVREMQ